MKIYIFKSFVRRWSWLKWIFIPEMIFIIPAENLEKAWDKLDIAIGAKGSDAKEDSGTLMVFGKKYQLYEVMNSDEVLVIPKNGSGYIISINE